MLGLVAGATDVIRGLGFLARRPRLWGWVAAPALAALLILVAVAWIGLALVDGGVGWLAGLFPAAVAGWVAGVLDVLFVILVAIAGYFIFFSLAAVIAAPFNEFLSEAVEVEVTGEPGPRFSPLGFVRDVVIGVAHAARRMVKYLFVVALLFVAGVVIPVIGPPLAAVAGAWVTARFAAYEALDAVWARRGMSYKGKMAALRARRGRYTGLGAGVALLLLVPGPSLIALSAGAVAATLLEAQRSPRPG
jgi:CysZ protein